MHIIMILYNIFQIKLTRSTQSVQGCYTLCALRRIEIWGKHTQKHARDGRINRGVLGERAGGSREDCEQGRRGQCTDRSRRDKVPTYPRVDGGTCGYYQYGNAECERGILRAGNVGTCDKVYTSAGRGSTVHGRSAAVNKDNDIANNSLESNLSKVQSKPESNSYSSNIARRGDSSRGGRGHGKRISSQGQELARSSKISKRSDGVSNINFYGSSNQDINDTSINHSGAFVNQSRTIGNTTSINGSLMNQKRKRPIISQNEVITPSSSSYSRLTTEKERKNNSILTNNASSHSLNSYSQLNKDPYSVSTSDPSTSSHHHLTTPSSTSPVIPSDFLDSLTHSLMSVPMLLPSGHHVDCESIRKADKLASETGRPPFDPFTGVPYTR